MKTRFIAVLAASVMMLAGSQLGFAQDEGGDQPVDVPSEDASVEESSQPADEDDAEGDAKSDEPQGSDDSEGPDDSEAAPEDAAAADEADEAGAQADAAQADQEEDGDEGPRVGPGGKPLREDYPGTEESKQARMDTERIEGLTFEEGESEEVYDLRIRELETKVDDLKEKVFRSKSRIVLLKETVLTGNLAGSRAIVSHENALGGAYKLRRAHYALDGSRIYNEVDEDDSLSDRDEIELFNGSITPGAHRVSILLELQGSSYGVFSYMNDYKFTLKDSCEFSSQEGRSSVVKIRLVDRAGKLSDYEERPGIECVINTVELSGDGLERSGAAEDEATLESELPEQAGSGADEATSK